MPAGGGPVSGSTQSTIKARKLQAGDGNYGTEDIEGVDGNTGGGGAIDGAGRGSTGC